MQRMVCIYGHNIISLDFCDTITNLNFHKMDRVDAAENFLTNMFSTLEINPPVDPGIDPATGIRYDILTATAIKDIKSPHDIGQIIMASIPTRSSHFTSAGTGFLYRPDFGFSPKPVLRLAYNPEAKVVTDGHKVVTSLLFRLVGKIIPTLWQFDLSGEFTEFYYTLIDLGRYLKEQEEESAYMTREEYSNFIYGREI